MVPLPQLLLLEGLDHLEDTLHDGRHVHEVQGLGPRGSVGHIFATELYLEGFTVQLYLELCTVQLYLEGCIVQLYLEGCIVHLYLK